MSDILLGVIVFSSVILLLVIILNVLGDILLPQGEVTLLINNDVDKSINVQTGGTVLSALADQSVYLPSACGGQGTCAQCKCQVVEGGGDILPTEEAYISRSDQKDNWRLGCQVKIRNDMKIKVPDEIFSIRKWDAVVKSNDNVHLVYPGVGDNLDFIDKNLMTNANSFIRRKEDIFCYQFSNKGFFNFKKNIPRIISELNLSK